MVLKSELLSKCKELGITKCSSKTKAQLQEMIDSIGKSEFPLEKKKHLGQFFTTNYKYILQDMVIPQECDIIEPFAGNGDLVDFIKSSCSLKKLECYDIDVKHAYIIQRDTLSNPPCYDNKFVVTNPPYLARNKNTSKELYDKYDTNDLYKCFIINVINSECLGGIIIVPLNFICSIRKSDIELRRRFLFKFNITIINIFEEKVFSDTSYTVCSIQFTKNSNDSTDEICVNIYPSKMVMHIKLTPTNNYTIGGEIYNLHHSKVYKIERATKMTKSKECITDILLKCIDDSIQSKICLSIDKQRIDNTPKLSERSYATLVISPQLSKENQLILVNKFNEYIEEWRSKFNSLFLSNYRESNSIARKRISFELAFSICSYLIDFI